jgi:hypothetical protein
MEHDMRQILSFISLIALVCAGSAVAQMPMDTTTRGYLQKPQPLLTSTRGTQRTGERGILLIRTDPTGDVATRMPADTLPATATRYNFTGGEAESYLTKHGYVSVNSLRQDSSTVWRALAVRNGRPVEVAVDYQGNIFER